MRRNLILATVLALAMALWTGLAHGQPTTVSYQGSLMKGPGTAKPVYDGNADFKFAVLCGGAIVWNSDAGSPQTGDPVASVPVDVELGVFSVLLGDTGLGMPPLTASILDGCTTPALRVWVDTGEGFEQMPDQPFSSSAFSLKADTAMGLPPGSAVGSLNGLTDDVTLAAGNGIQIDAAKAPGTLTISATGGGAGDSDWVISGDDMSSGVSGNVGIGTASPQAKIHASGTQSLELRLDADSDNNAEDEHPFITMTQDGGAVRGQVGFFGAAGTGDNDLILRNENTSSGRSTEIRMTDVSENVEVNGDVLIGGGDGIENLPEDDRADGSEEAVVIRGASEEWRVGVINDATTAESDFFVSTSFAGSQLRIQPDGNVGIGTDNPSSKLHVAGTTTIQNGDVRLQTSAGQTTIQLDAVENDNTGQILLYRNNGVDPAIEIDGARSDGGAAVLMYDPAGNTAVSLDALDTGAPDATGGQILVYNGASPNVASIEIDGNVGGGLSRITTNRLVADVVQINGADLSEGFDIHADGGGIEPGMVVSIDPSNPGHLVVTDQEYDRRVAGVVSGAGGVRAGLLMGQDGTAANGEHPVALTGRVYCWADASSEPIEPGDLLTASSIPGHAMTASDHARAQGAIIGKAMTNLASGRGLVLVLVSLQ